MQDRSCAVKPIGGYLELQLPEGKEYYSKLIRLNTGRNCLEYILRAEGFAAVYLPYFTCEVLLEPIKKLNIAVNFYLIDHRLEPIIDFEVGPNECLVYTNYFGLKQRTVSVLAQKIRNLIVDNSQAFFSAPLKNINTFYSCRKFFGVCDGAYLSTNSTLEFDLEQDQSVERFSHLIRSIDSGIESGYKEYLQSTADLVNNPMRAMSPLTRRILCSINYEQCKVIRNENFAFLHHALGKDNELKWNLSDLNAPMCYPLLVRKPGIRTLLNNNRIYVPLFWPNVLKWATPEMFEHYLSTNLLALPVDHRYTLQDMQHIINVLKLI